MYTSITTTANVIKVHSYRLTSIKELSNGLFSVMNRPFASLDDAKAAVDGTYSFLSSSIKRA